MKGIL